MRRIVGFILVLLAASASLLQGSSQPAQARTGKALFIYWRGETDCEKGLKDGLQSAGVNVSIVEFNAEQHKQNLDNFVSSIDEKQYDFIYTFGTTVTETVSAHVKKTPILFGIVASPVKAGIIDSWESPGKNVTGISHILPMQEQVDFIFRLGNYKRIGMLYNPKEENSQIAHEELGIALSERGLKLVDAPLTSEDNAEQVLYELISKSVDLVYLPSDSYIISKAKDLIPVLTKHKIPTYGAVEALIKNGAMVGVVSSYYAVGRGLAKMAKAVLNGKSPAEIPAVRLPLSMQTILVNDHTVSQLGLAVPDDIVRIAKVMK